jgi:hypothetical protein
MFALAAQRRELGATHEMLVAPVQQVSENPISRFGRD